MEVARTDVQRKILIKLESRDIEVEKSLPHLIKDEKLYNNKSEIFRRGFHITVNLINSKEEPLIKLLFDKLNDCQNDLDSDNLEIIKSLASAIYAIFIAKQGILGAEIFETVKLTCDLLNNKEVDQTEVLQTLQDLSTTIKIVFLSDLIRPATPPPENFAKLFHKKFSGSEKHG